MSELLSSISKEARQVGGVLSAGKDIFWGLRNKRHKPHLIQSMVLMGLSALIPEQFQATGILQNPQRIEAVNAIKEYMVAQNDRIDFEGSEREDIADLLDSIHDLERTRKAAMDQTISALPDGEREWVRGNIGTAISEVEFVEDWIRDKQEKDNISLADVDTYRTTVNAVCEITALSIIFGPDNFSYNLKPIDGQMDIQAVVDKYAWILGRNPKSETDRAIMIAHNMAAAMQIIDDWKGLDIDKLLRVPTYAIVALRVSNGDKKYAKTLLKSIEEKYRRRAQELGAGKITGEALYRAYTLGQNVHNWIAKTGREHDLAKRLFGGRKLGLREEVYMKRRI